MKQISESLDHIEVRKRFTEWMETLPDVDPDQKCLCGQCDGYGNLIEKDRYGVTRARRCTNKARSDKVRFLYDKFKDWEEWSTVSRFTLQTYVDREDFVETPAFTACENYLDDIHSGREIKPLILLGSHGRSKSLAPLFLLKEIAITGHGVHALKWYSLIDAYRKGIDGNKFIESQVKRINGSYFVFIDEYGRGDSDTHNYNAMRKILDLTYRKKWLVISSNLTMVEFLDSLDSYAQDRLKPKISNYVNDKEDESLRMF